MLRCTFLSLSIAIVSILSTMPCFAGDALRGVVLDSYENRPSDLLPVVLSRLQEMDAYRRRRKFSNRGPRSVTQISDSEHFAG